MSTTVTSVRIPDDILAALDALAASRDRARNYLIVEALEAYLHRQAPGEEDLRLLPSQRPPYVPPPNSDEEAFLANLDAAYDDLDPNDTLILEGARRAMRRVLEAAE